MRVQTTLNHISVCFYHDIDVKDVFFRARAEKNIARHIDASTGVVWTLIDNGKLAIARLAAIVVNKLF